MKDYSSMQTDGQDKKEELKDMIVAKIENMNNIPWTCSTCPFQTSFGICQFLKPEHQNCPVTFYQELVGPATYKTADGVTVINVFKTGRRCLCPLEEKEG